MSKSQKLLLGSVLFAGAFSQTALADPTCVATDNTYACTDGQTFPTSITAGTDTGEFDTLTIRGNTSAFASPWSLTVVNSTANTPFAISTTGAGTLNATTYINGTATTITQAHPLTIPWVLNQTGGSMNLKSSADLFFGGTASVTYPIKMTGGATSDIEFLAPTANYSTVATVGGSLTNTTAPSLWFDGGVHNVTFNGTLTKDGLSANLVQITNSPTLNVNLVGSGLANSYIDAAGANATLSIQSLADRDFQTSTLDNTNGTYRNFDNFVINVTDTVTITFDPTLDEGETPVAKDWQITSGILRVGNSASLGNVSIAQDGTLIYTDSSTNATLNGTINGSLEIDVDTKTVTLGSSSTSANATIAVTSGTLNVGSVATTNTTLSVSAGSTFATSADQNLNSLTMGAASVYDMSSAVSTTTLSNNFACTSGVFGIAVGSSASKLVAASGKSIALTSPTFNFAAVGPVQPNTNYTILTADGGLTVSSPVAVEGYDYLDAVLTLDDDNYMVKFVHNENSIVSEATTPNTRAVATAIEAMGADSDLYNNIRQVNANQMDAALAQLDGENIISMKQNLSSLQNFVMGAVKSRMYSGLDNRSSASLASLTEGEAIQVASAGNSGLVGKSAQSDNKLWAKVLGGTSRTGNYKSFSGSKGELGGFVVGADHTFAPNALAGVMVGYDKTKLKNRNIVSSTDIDTVHLAAYGTVNVAKMFDVSLAATHAMHDVDSKRSISFAHFAANPTGSYKAHSTSGSVEVSKEFKVQKLALEPYLNYAYNHQHVNAYSEQNGNGAELRFNADNTHFNTYGAGLRVGHTIDVAKTQVDLYGKGGYVYNDGDTTRVSSVRFVDGTDSFNVSGQGVRKNTGLVGVGFNVNLPKNMVVGVGYDGTFAKASTSHIGNLNFKVHF